MKTEQKRIIGTLLVIVGAFILTMSCTSNNNYKIEQLEIKNNNYRDSFIIDNKEITEYVAPVIVFDNMTLDQLAEKLNRSLKNELSNKGIVYASHALSIGLDPYLAVAVSLHETGCKWNCSYLMRVCNNVGGQKGGPTCNGGSYKAYSSLDEGIIGFMDNLYNNYVAIGLSTTEQINKKYAEDPNWSKKINNYINEIKAK